ncbi:hypothetical protein Q0Z83_059890 [Actinoplanes sichuanensis]|nr:hypothetical protein Q0Z83_059890 [Actinoplanes sichuanensis]
MRDRMGRTLSRAEQDEIKRMNSENAAEAQRRAADRKGKR